MRAVVTIVRWAQVEVEGEVCAKIGQGAFSRTTRAR